MLTDLIKNKKEFEAISLFKNQNFDLNFTDKFHKTILMYACEYKMHSLIDVLIEKYKSNQSFNLNMLDNQDKTALYYSCDNQDVASIDKLILAGLDIDSMNKDLLTAINYCASHNLNVSASALLKHSPDLSHTDRTRRNPLMWACKLNNRNLFASLLEIGIDTNKIDDTGMSCLFYVINNNDNSMIDSLVKHGANVNLSNEMGKTALHHAAQFNKLFVIPNLIEKGADINLLDHRGKTCLMYACENDHLDLAKILIIHGARFSFKNLYDKKGFKTVADNMQMFKFLLSHTPKESQLMEYEYILSQLESDYREHIQLIESTLLNQKLASRLLKSEYIDDKKTKI